MCSTFSSPRVQCCCSNILRSLFHRGCPRRGSILHFFDLCSDVDTSCIAPLPCGRGMGGSFRRIEGRGQASLEFLSVALPRPSWFFSLFPGERRSKGFLWPSSSLFHACQNAGPIWWKSISCPSPAFSSSFLLPLSSVGCPSFPCVQQKSILSSSATEVWGDRTHDGSGSVSPVRRSRERRSG